MLKFGTVLLVLGIALGLWIAFNPQAHQKAVQSWEDAKASFIQMEAKVSATTHGWALDLKANGQGGTQQVNNVWKEFTSMLTTLWDSLRQLWVSLTTRLRISS